MTRKVIPPGEGMMQRAFGHLHLHLMIAQAAFGRQQQSKGFHPCVQRGSLTPLDAGGAILVRH